MFPILPIRGLAVFLASWKLFDVSFPEPRIGAPTWRHVEQVACADLGAIDTAHWLSLVRRMGTYALALDRLDAGYVLLRRLRRQDETTTMSTKFRNENWRVIQKYRKLNQKYAVSRRFCSLIGDKSRKAGHLYWKSWYLTCGNVLIVSTQTQLQLKLSPNLS